MSEYYTILIYHQLFVVVYDKYIIKSLGKIWTMLFSFYCTKNTKDKTG